MTLFKLKILILTLFLIIFCVLFNYRFSLYAPVISEKSRQVLIRQNLLYLPESTYYIVNQNYLYAKDSKTEKEKWKFELPYNNTLFEVNPVNDNSSIYFIFDNILYSLDKETGKQNWKSILPKNDYYLPDIDGKILYFASKDGYLYSVDTGNGNHKLIFQDKTKTLLPGKNKKVKPSVNVSFVYSSSERKRTKYNYYFNFYQFDSNNGNLKRHLKLKREDPARLLSESDNMLNIKNTDDSFKSGNPGKSILAFKNTIFYYYRKFGKNYFCSLDSNGKPLWFLNQSPSELIITSEMSFFEDSGYLHAIDSKTGEINWRFKENGLTTKLMMSGNTIYFQDSFNSIYALKAKTGEEIWHYENSNLIFSPEIVGNNLYFILSSRAIISMSYLYVLDCNTGDIKWKFELGKDEWLYSLNASKDKLSLITTLKVRRIF